MINAPRDADVQIVKTAVLSSLIRLIGSVGPASSLHATSQQGSIFPF